MDYLTDSFSTAVNEGKNIYPRLIEPNIKYIVYSTLQNCHNHRVKIYNWVFNILIFLGFVSFFGAVLYYCYKTKPTPEERRQRMMRDQNYIMSKIRFYQNEKLKERGKTSDITNLPVFSL